MSDSSWIAVTAVSQAFAAFATLAAVMVTVCHFRTLWKRRAHLSVDEVVQVNKILESKNYISVSITNVGVAPIQITGIQYSPGLRSSSRWFHMYDSTILGSSELPIKLDSTESAQFFWKPEDWDSAIGEPIDKRRRESWLFRWFWQYSLKVQAKSSTGDIFSARLSKRLRKRLSRHSLAGHKSVEDS